MTFGLQVSDDGLDGGAAAQFAFDNTEYAALLAGDEDAALSGNEEKRRSPSTDTAAPLFRVDLNHRPPMPEGGRSTN